MPVTPHVFSQPFWRIYMARETQCSSLPRVSKPTHRMRSLYITIALLAPLPNALRPDVHDSGMA